MATTEIKISYYRQDFLGDMFFIPYEDKHITIRHDYIVSSQRGESFVTINLTDDEDNIAPYKICMKKLDDGTEVLDIVEKDGKIFLNVQGYSETIIGDKQEFSFTESKYIELPINAKNCPVLKDLKTLTIPTVSSANYDAVSEDIARTYASEHKIKYKEEGIRVVEEDSHERNETSSSKEKNLVFKQGEVSYIYLPYKNGDKDTHLRIAQHEGKVYINLKGLDASNPAKEITCEILQATFRKTGDQNLLTLEMNVNGEKRRIALPVTKEGNESVVQTLTTLIGNQPIQVEEINLEDTPQVENLTYDPNINKSQNIDLEQDSIAGTKTGQVLRDTTLTIGDEKINGLSQSVSTQKLGLQAPQTLTLLDSRSYTSSSGSSVLSNVLMTVSLPGQPPVAIFTQDLDADGNIQTKLKISKEFLEKFRAENEGVEIPEGVQDGDYIIYDVDKLKLDENLNIQDVQVKAANSKFAIMFSALGAQIVDASNNRGILRNTEKPFDIGYSTEYLKQAFDQEKNLEEGLRTFGIPPKGVSRDALLIQVIQQQRRKAIGKENETIGPIKLGDETLYSVPINVTGAENNPQYLYIKQDETGKSYVYLHTTNESAAGRKSPTYPKFHEIAITHLEGTVKEKSTTLVNPVLFMGLKSGKAVSRVNIGLSLDDDLNKHALTTLHTILPKPFEATKVVQGEEDTQPLMINGKKVVRQIDGKEFVIYPTPTDASATINSFDGVNVLSRSPVEKKPLNSVGYIQNPPNATKKEEKKQEEKKPIKWPKDQEPKDRSKLYAGLFVLFAALSIILPLLSIVAFVVGFVGVMDVAKPWDLGSSNSQISVDKLKEKIKENEKSIYRSREIQLQKQLELKNLEQEREKILNDPKLSAAQRKKALEEIDKKIKEKKIDIAKEQKTRIIEEKKLKALKKEEEIRKKKAELKKKKDEKKKAENAIKDDRKKLTGADNKRKSAKSTYDKIEKEIEELKALEKKSYASLTDEEKKKLKKLRGKYGKKKNKALSEAECNKIVEESKKKYDEAEKEYTELEEQIKTFEDGRQVIIDETSDLDKEVIKLEGEKASLDKEVKALEEQRKAVTDKDAIIEEDLDLLNDYKLEQKLNKDGSLSPGEFLEKAKEHLKTTGGRERDI